ncbi:MAG: aromatic hydrocarbon degradation protein, partial [Desulfobacterales bacterium]
MGKAGANIASASRADAAYYNPAKMGQLADSWQMELDANYIHLSAIDYHDDRKESFNHQS